MAATSTRISAEGRVVQMGIARPKTYVMIKISNFTGEAKCFIHCFPQQRWNYNIDNDRVELTYKNMDLSIPKSDFERFWKVVE